MMKILSLFLIFFSFWFNSYSQNRDDINFQDFIMELQRWEKNENKIVLVWWVPSSYWEITKKMNPDLSDSALKIFEDAFKDYYLVFALSCDIDGINFNFLSYSTIFDNIMLVDENGKKYYPINEFDVPTNTLNVMSTFEPVIKNVLGGSLGKGIRFYLFPKYNNQGKTIINENKETQFKFELFDDEFNFQLPLVSLMKDKYCPIDNATMKGNWEYCPFHGVKLD